MYLYLNTSSPKKIIIALFNKSGKILKFKKITAKYKQSEKLLSEIDKLIPGLARESSLAKPGIKGILVIKGPGSFTALRIGLTTANTLAWTLSIPILGVLNKNESDDKILIDKNYKKLLKLKTFKQVLPVYGKEPNITTKK